MTKSTVETSGECTCRRHDLIGTGSPKYAEKKLSQKRAIARRDVGALFPNLEDATREGKMGSCHAYISTSFNV